MGPAMNATPLYRTLPLSSGHTDISMRVTKMCPMENAIERIQMKNESLARLNFHHILEQIDLYGIKILELVYCQDALTLQEVLKQSHVKMSRKVAMKRLKLLRAWQLLEYGGNPICIYQVRSLKDSVRKLIVLFFGRWGLGHER